MKMTAMNVVMNDYNHRKTRHLTTQKPCTASLFRPHVSPIKRGRLSKVEKTTAVLKRAMTENRETWQGNGKETKSRWQQTVWFEGGQSSHDTWDISRPKGKWREISAEMDEVGSAVKEKSNTWKKCKEKAKREAELFKMVEVGVTDEKQEERERGSFEKEGTKRTKQGI